MAWVEEDVSVIKIMVETQQDVVNVTLANNSSLLYNSGHLPVTSTPAGDTSSVIVHIMVWLEYHADLHNLNDSMCLISHLSPAVA